MAEWNLGVVRAYRVQESVECRDVAEFSRFKKGRVLGLGGFIRFSDWYSVGVVNVFVVLFFVFLGFRNRLSLGMVRGFRGEGSRVYGQKYF